MCKRKDEGTRCLTHMAAMISPAFGTAVKDFNAAKASLKRAGGMTTQFREAEERCVAAIDAADTTPEIKEAAREALATASVVAQIAAAKSRLKESGKTVPDTLNDRHRKAKEASTYAKERLSALLDERDGSTSLSREAAMSVPLHAAHALPAGLIPSDGLGNYPHNADPEVIADLRQHPVRFIVVDVETTGFDPKTGAQITEISWYSLNSGDGGTFIPAHTLEGANEEALKISRYADRIEGKPQDDGAQVRALHQLLGGDGQKVHLVGSNPGFDAEHIGALFAKYGLEGRNGAAGPWQHRLIDPAAAAYFAFPDVPFGAPTGLKEASAAAQVDLTDHHAARADVDAAAQIWHALESRRRKQSK